MPLTVNVQLESSPTAEGVRCLGFGLSKACNVLYKWVGQKTKDSRPQVAEASAAVTQSEKILRLRSTREVASSWFANS